MLSFRLFDMEADPTCRYDYLDVYNGHSRLVQKLGRFCGTFRPGALITTSNTMMLDMVSDDATGGRGFLAYFSAGKPHVEGVDSTVWRVRCCSDIFFLSFVKDFGDLFTLRTAYTILTGINKSLQSV